MALNCYTGLMGSGKSYEVVSGPLIAAMAAGRRVVSNIDGLNEEAIGDYIRSNFKDSTEVGQLVHVSNDDVMKLGFFPTDKTVESSESVVKAGDLVVIDECWRFWGTGCKITPEHKEFFRMHRHYVCAENGYACDLIMMIQDIGSLNRGVKDVVEFSTKTVKLKALGLHKKYRIEMYETGKLTSTTKLDTFVKSYKPEIFPLYSSYKGGKGKEVVVDDRQNVLKNRKWLIIFGGLFCVGVLFFGVRIVWRHFHPTKNSMAASGASSVAGSVTESGAAFDASKSELRYVGRMMTAQLGEMVVFADASGKLRYEFSTVCSGPRLSIRCIVDGKTVTTESGSLPSSAVVAGMFGGAKK